MPIIDCLQKAEKDKGIKSHFSSITEGMSESQQRDMAIELANKYYEKLREEANKFSKSVGHLPKKVDQIDKSSDIEKLRNEYDAKIKDAENEINSIKQKAQTDINNIKNQQNQQNEQSATSEQKTENGKPNQEVRQGENTAPSKISSAEVERPKTAAQFIKAAGNMDLSGQLEGQVMQLMMGVKMQRSVLYELFGDGGKANSEDSRMLRAGKRFVGKPISGELKNKDAFLNSKRGEADKKFESVDDIAHYILENIGGLSDDKIDLGEIKKIVEDTIISFDSPSEIAEHIYDNFMDSNHDMDKEMHDYMMSQLPEGVDPITGQWIPGYGQATEAIFAMSDAEIDSFLKDEEAFFNSPEYTGIEKKILSGDSNGGTPNENKNESSSGSKDEFTHVNKSDITDAETLAKKYQGEGSEVTWAESVTDGIRKLASEAKKGEKLPDVAERMIGEWSQRIEKELSEKGKSTFNPSDEDIAIMSYWRTHLNTEMDSVKKDIESTDEFTVSNAIDKFNELSNKLLKVDRVLKESGRTAGRAFYIKQMIAKMDSDNSITIKRMDIISRQGGEKLSKEQEINIAKIVAEENKLHKEAEVNIPKFSQEDFDAKVKSEVARLLKEKKESQSKTREKTLTQSGKELADKIRKAKTQRGDTALDVTFGMKNLAVEAVAQLVEKGAMLGDAIKQVLSDIKYKGLSEDDLTNHIISGIDKSDILDKMKEISDKEKSDSITVSVVAKGLVNDLVNSYIGQGLKGKGLFEEMKKDLSDIYKGITDQQIRDSYLKQGEFKLKRTSEIDKEKKQTQTELRSIANLETKIKNARDGVAGAKNDAERRKYSEEEQQLQKELRNTLRDKAIKIEKGGREEVSIKKKIAESHNERMDKLIENVNEKLKDDNLSKEEKDALKKLKNTASTSKVDVNTAEKIDNVLAKSQEQLRLAGVDIVGDSKLHSEVVDAVLSIDKDVENSVQDIALARHKKNLENKAKEWQRKLDEGEVDDTPPTVRTKSDAESIRLEIEEGKLQARFRREQYLAEQKNKKWYEKAAAFAHTVFVQGLIGGLKTAGVVLTSGLTKQPLNTLTNSSFGWIAHTLFPELSKYAGAEAKASFLQEKNRYMAHYGAIGEKGMQKIWDNAKANLDKANSNYSQAKLNLDNTPTDSNDYSKVKKEFDNAKQEQINALVDHQSKYLFDWIGSNSWKDGADYFTKGASQLDVLLGHDEQVGYKDMTRLERAEYIIGFMGNLHGLMKSFSARAEFAASFTARLENKAKQGVDISSVDEVLATINDSYVNFLMGKYQEDNWVTSKMNRVGEMLAETSPRKYAADKTPKNVTLGKIAAAAYKGKFPIVRTPVNIGREAIVEYLFGTPIGAALHGKEVVKGVFQGLKEGSPIKEKIKEAISKMPPDRVDLIFRCYRKGGLGLVLAAMAAYGYVNFGGFHNEDDWYRKKGQMNQGDLEIFGTELSHTFGGRFTQKALEHSGVMMPALMFANLREVYDRKYKQLMTKEKKKNGMFSSNEDAVSGVEHDAATEALISDMWGALHVIPVFNSGFQNPLTNPKLPYSGVPADITEALDSDEAGNQIRRDNKTFYNRFLINTGFRNFVPVNEKKATY